MKSNHRQKALELAEVYAELVEQHQELSKRVSHAHAELAQHVEQPRSKEGDELKRALIAEQKPFIVGDGRYVLTWNGGAFMVKVAG